MNYYDARQKETNQRWDYTQMRDNQAWPIGYCAGFRLYSVRDFERMWPADHALKVADDLNDKYGPFKEKFHKDGHATKEEAYACYKEYILDTGLTFERHTIEEAKKMRGTITYCEYNNKNELTRCNEMTANFVMITGRIMYLALCDKHFSRECVSEMYSVGQSFGSY